METALKQSLLLTHGTVYGVMLPVAPWVDCQNMDRWGSTTPWITTVPYVAAGPLENMVGSLTDNSPIDLISWTAGPGQLCPDPMEWWRSCTHLMMHI